MEEKMTREKGQTQTFICTKQSQTEAFRWISADLVHLPFEWIHLFKKHKKIL